MYFAFSLVIGELKERNFDRSKSERKAKDKKSKKKKGERKSAPCNQHIYSQHVYQAKHKNIFYPYRGRIKKKWVGLFAILIFILLQETV